MIPICSSRRLIEFFYLRLKILFFCNFKNSIPPEGGWHGFCNTFANFEFLNDTHTQGFAHTLVGFVPNGD